MTKEKWKQNRQCNWQKKNENRTDNVIDKRKTPQKREWTRVLWKFKFYNFTINLLMIQSCPIRTLYILHIIMTGRWPSTSTNNFFKDLQPQEQISVLLYVNKIYWNFHQSVCEKRQADITFLINCLWNKDLFLPGTEKRKMKTLFSTIITMSCFVSVWNLKKDSDDRGNYFNMYICLVYGV